MKKLATIVALIVASATVSADTYVRGYIRSDGSYVAPHYRSSPDSSRFNNYSTQGNVNPYTGQPGTVNPYATPGFLTPNTPLPRHKPIFE